MAITMETVVDARGLFDALTNRDLGKLTDKSMALYVISYREQLRSRIVARMHWVPTESMLADDLTKKMIYGSGLWPILFCFAFWQPDSRPELTEDYVTWYGNNGEVVRYRLGDVVRTYVEELERPLDAEETA